MKKILFVTSSMNCGGVERTLINLFKSLDYEKYSVDLLLMDNKGEFLKDVPKYVKILELDVSKWWKFIINNISQSIFDVKKQIGCFNFMFLSYLCCKVINKLCIIFFKYNFVYELCFKKIDINKLNYDVICDYHGYGYFTTFLVSNLNNNAIKLSWIHEENINTAYKNIEKCYYKFDKVIGVSKECINNFHKEFAKIEENRLSVIHNIVFKEQILELSNADRKIDYKKNNKFFICSVGRLSIQKGFDLAIEVAKKLKNEKRSFIWVIIGEGPERKSLYKLIEKYELNDYVILHGYDDNPYSYIKDCDLYVQTSRYEGFVTTITEAVFLSKAIVSTNFSGVSEQVINNLNGFVTDFDSDKVKYYIEKIMDSSILKEELENGNNSIDLTAKKSLENLYNIFERGKYDYE